LGRIKSPSHPQKPSYEAKVEPRIFEKLNKIRTSKLNSQKYWDKWNHICKRDFRSFHSTSNHFPL